MINIDQYPSDDHLVTSSNIIIYCFFPHPQMSIAYETRWMPYCKLKPTPRSISASLSPVRRAWWSLLLGASHQSYYPQIAPWKKPWWDHLKWDDTWLGCQLPFVQFLELSKSESRHVVPAWSTNKEQFMGAIYGVSTESLSIQSAL